jgi:peptidoglycan/xylan/chitin deacetylase (PgdA/CDA1 family)
MGSVVISLDAELGWGFHDRDPVPADRIRSARTAWRDLCRLFDRFDVPATWAVVGHLLLADCDAEHPGHPAGPRCCDGAPGAMAADEAWHGRDLVERVLAADADHDLAGHGFTHVHFDHGLMRREFAAAELRAWGATAAAVDVSPGSFVFPVNRVGYRDLLVEHGFDAYRGRQPSRRGRVRKLSDALRACGTPPLVSPSVDEYGLVNVPASAYLFGFDGYARSAVEAVRGDPVVDRVERALAALDERGGVLHLWFHPHDLVRERDFERVRRVVEAVARARATTDVRVETMAAVADRVRERHGEVSAAARTASR